MVGNSMALPTLSSEWIESQWDGSPDGMLRVIEGGSHGERSNLSYEDVHRSYSEIAESATQRETIPLTRREYIRQYFEAIRPNQP